MITPISSTVQPTIYQLIHYKRLTKIDIYHIKIILAEVVELVDAQVSGICGSNPVGVRVPPSAYF